MTSDKKFLMTAIEPSADSIGAALLPEIKEVFPNAEFLGCGGPLMAAQGFKTAFDTRSLAVMGFSDVARALPAGWRGARQMAQLCADHDIDAAILIDGWAFSRLAAKRIKQRSPRTRLYKLAAPQIWASRPQRLEFVKQHFDGVLTLLPFEPPLFEAVGVPSVFIGNPTFENAFAHKAEARRFRQARGWTDDDLVLAVLPGSRRGEVTRLIDVFGSALRMVKERHPDVKIIAPIASSVTEIAIPLINDWPFDVDIIKPEEKYAGFSAADVALSASGTVTTELAICETAQVIAYRVDPLTAVWARRIKVTPYASILNVAADDFVIPELIQEKCTAEGLRDALLRLIEDEAARQAQVVRVSTLCAEFAPKSQSAAARAAMQIARWLDVS